MSDLPYRPNVGAVLFTRDGLVFVARRADMPNAEGPAGGWQLPQGGIDEGEDPRVAVLRELEEEIGVETEIGDQIHHVVHAYPDRDVRLYFYDARILSGEPQKLEVADLRWVTHDEIMLYQFPEADIPLLKQLRGM